MIIITNKYEDLDIVDVFDYDELVSRIYDASIDIENSDYTISLYAGRDIVDYVFTELIKLDFDVRHTEYDMVSDENDYEYLLTIDGYGGVSVEKARTHGQINENESSVALIIMDDCKQDIVDYCINNDKNTILIGFEPESEYFGCESKVQAVEFIVDDGCKITLQYDDNSLLKGFSYRENTIDSDVYFECNGDNPDDIYEQLAKFLGNKN